MKESIKLADYLADQARNLLAQYISAAEEAALESDEAKAKVALKMEWELNSSAPNTKVRLSFTTAHQDEIESRFDPDQGKLFGDVDRVTMKAGDGPEVTLVNNWVNAGERLPDDETLVKVEDEDGDLFTGSFGHDEDYDCTIFNCADGGCIQVEHIAKWRHVDAAETEQKGE